ncbi:MAG: electron transfer flavoprotein subunit alpha/FixB family protein [Bdellovibrionaceae bacterium]|nr:electron transfer flavoprotein subunit alpha/FixB family protein [Pseudobdellovibrionaceae bacterium]
MNKLVVFCEHQSHNLKRSSIELLQFGRSKNFHVVGVVLGSEGSAAAEQATANGAHEVLWFDDAKLNGYNPELFLTALEVGIKQSDARHVLAPASSIGRDVFPRLAARLDSSVASDCVALSVDDNAFVAKKPMYSGKCFAQVSLKDSPYQIVLMRANQLPVAAAGSSNAGAIKKAALPDVSLKTILKEVVKGASEKLDLTEANIIVSGGRGLKEAGNFKMLEDMANVLGATVGASRAVVDSGWVSHSMQVGQTGKTVAPTLYIAVGISGAIQHLAGMTGSKVIVAINNDPNAPIFQKATYGIVGDLFDVVPKLTEEFKKLLHK